VTGAMTSRVSRVLLADFFDNSNVGLAIFDDQLRYVAINPCLAAMHGISVQSHLGKTLREVLGQVALQVEPAFRQVLATGQPFLNLDITGALPAKTEMGHWIDNLFPITGAHGRVKQVGAVVLELPPDTKLAPAGAIHEAESLPDTAKEVLRSWKETANYVGVCVKTVQRWEQHYHFPIRRLERRKGSVVFVLKADVDRWIRMRTRMTSSP
jgi:PAS domain-containing protein